MIDEADKAPEHVVAIFKSLAGQSELSLPDGRRICSRRERDTDIVVHKDFRLVLLANRPGYRQLLPCLAWSDWSLTRSQPSLEISFCRFSGKMYPCILYRILTRYQNASF
jgi:hypothetical protein